MSQIFPSSSVYTCIVMILSNSYWIHCNDFLTSYWPYCNDLLEIFLSLISTLLSTLRSQLHTTETLQFLFSGNVNGFQKRIQSSWPHKPNVPCHSSILNSKTRFQLPLPSLYSSQTNSLLKTTCILVFSSPPMQMVGKFLFCIILIYMEYIFHWLVCVCENILGATIYLM